jgi:hypothetical protein
MSRNNAPSSFPWALHLGGAVVQRQPAHDAEHGPGDARHERESASVAPRGDLSPAVGRGTTPADPGH